MTIAKRILETTTLLEEEIAANHGGISDYARELHRHLTQLILIYKKPGTYQVRVPESINGPEGR